MESSTLQIAALTTAQVIERCRNACRRLPRGRAWSKEQREERATEEIRKEFPGYENEVHAQIHVSFGDDGRTFQGSIYFQHLAEENEGSVHFM